MATNFPGSLDDNTNLPNPGTGSFTNNPSHAGQHDNENDAIKAIEAKIGIGASTPTSGKVFRGTSAGVSSWGALVLTTDVTGLLPVANGGTGVGASTGTVAVVLSTSPTIITALMTGSNGKTALDFADGASSVNNLRATASATTVAPSLSTVGTDTNIPLNLAPKGNELVQMSGVSIDPTNSFYNTILNGACLVGQRAAPSLSTAYQYGQVDRFACKATGTAVSAGTITQNTAPNAVSTGYVLKVAGATVTGVGIIYARYRIESLDSLKYKNGVASFGVWVYQDTTVNVSYTIFINKATVADNFTATTAIANSGAIVVPSGVATFIKFENINSGNIGDVTNGIEIEIQAACGAITTKNFEFGEFQFNKGVHALPFRAREYVIELAACQRYYQVYVDPHISGMTAAATNAYSRMGFELPVLMRTTPTVVVGALNVFDGGNVGTISSVTVTYNGPQRLQFDGALSNAGFTVQRWLVAYNNSVGTKLTCDAEL